MGNGKWSARPTNLRMSSGQSMGSLALAGAQGTQVIDDEIDPLGDVRLPEQCVTQLGILHKLLSDHVTHDRWLRGAIEESLHLFDDFVREPQEDRFDSIAQAPRFRCGVLLPKGQGGDRFDAAERIGLARKPLCESHPAYPVQDQVGATIGLLAGCPDQSGGPNLSGAIVIFRSLLAGEAANAEQAVSLQCLAEHLTVAVFEYMEGKCAMRK